MGDLTPSSPRPRTIRLVGLGIADQVLVTVSTVAVTLLYARAVDAPTFGAVALALLGRVLAVEVGRAVAATPAQLTADRSGVDAGAGAAGALPVVGVAAMLGVALAVPALALAVVVPVVRLPLLVIGVGLPATLVLDVVRHLGLAVRSTVPVVLDAVVVGAQLATGLVLAAAGRTQDPDVHLVVLVAATGLVAVVGVRRLTPTTREVDRNGLGEVVAWWRETAGVRRGLLVDTAWSQAQRQALAWFLAGIGSLTVVAGYRGAQTAFRPLGLATTGSRMVAVPLLRGSHRLDPAVVVSGALVAVGAAITAMLSIIPDAAGRAVFGATWEFLRPLVVPVALAQVGQAAVVGAQVGLVVDGATDALARTRTVTVVGLLLTAVVVGALAGADAAIWAVGFGSLAVVPMWWWTRQRHRPEPAPTPTDERTHA